MMGHLFSYFFIAKTPDDDFSSVYEIKGNSYDLSNSNDVKNLLARIFCCHKNKLIIKSLIKCLCNKNFPKSTHDYYVRQIESLTLSDEDYEDYKRKLDKRKQEKAKYCAYKEKYSNDLSKKTTKKKIGRKKKSSS